MTQAVTECILLLTPPPTLLPPLHPLPCLQISSLVSERDAGLRLSLSNMGMTQSAYWVSWMAFDTLLTFATALLLVLCGECDLFVCGGVG